MYKDSQPLTPISFDYEPSENSIKKIGGTYNIFHKDINPDRLVVVSREFNGDGHLDLINYDRTDKTKFYIFNDLYKGTGSSTALEVEIDGGFDHLFPANFIDFNKLHQKQGIVTVKQTSTSNKQQRSSITFTVTTKRSKIRWVQIL